MSGQCTGDSGLTWALSLSTVHRRLSTPRGNPRPGGEWRSNGPPPPEASRYLNRILDPLHRHAVPARGRRRDGLVDELVRVAAPGHGGPGVLPQALPRLRGAGP